MRSVVRYYFRYLSPLFVRNVPLKCKVSCVSRVGPGVTLRATEDQSEMETEEGDKLGLLVVGGG